MPPRWLPASGCPLILLGGKRVKQVQLRIAEAGEMVLNLEFVQACNRLSVRIFSDAYAKRLPLRLRYEIGTYAAARTGNAELCPGWIASRFIFAIKVVRARPSLAAAPFEPPTTPSVCWRV